mmetsp:Transcript_24855/g.62936  ORF Transcript_24855/g.62936 Transcript_24855/m.62936 type:complete len:351 (-) Transcript_24855:29-1081(-)
MASASNEKSASFCASETATMSPGLLASSCFTLVCDCTTCELSLMRSWRFSRRRRSSAFCGGASSDSLSFVASASLSALSFSAFFSAFALPPSSESESDDSLPSFPAVFSFLSLPPSPSSTPSASFAPLPSFLPFLFLGLLGLRAAVPPPSGGVNTLSMRCCKSARDIAAAIAASAHRTAALPTCASICAASGPATFATGVEACARISASDSRTFLPVDSSSSATASSDASPAAAAASTTDISLRTPFSSRGESCEAHSPCSVGITAAGAEAAAVPARRACVADFSAQSRISPAAESSTDEPPRPPAFEACATEAAIFELRVHMLACSADSSACSDAASVGSGAGARTPPI